MAGGRFVKAVPKVLPGTYTNFESSTKTALTISDRGTALLPLCKPVYGPAGQMITLTADNIGGAVGLLGFQLTDDDPNRMMLLIRETMKRAKSVIVYIVTEGKKASAESGDLTVVAKYGGSRGNDFVVTVDANPIGGFDVIVSLGGSIVSKYEGLHTIAELKAAGDAFLDFDGEGNLAAIAGLHLEGGKDQEPTNADITRFLDAAETVHWDTMCFPVDDEGLKAAAVSKVKYIRDNIGHSVQVALPDYHANDEGVINVTNSVVVDGIELTHAEACAWVAGATAGASFNQSLTYVAYDGASDVLDKKSLSQAEAAVKAGEFFFIMNDENVPVVQYDINSLTDYASPKSESYRKNRVQRVLSTLNATIQLNFPPNKYDNDNDGWDIMEGIGRSILKQFADARALTNVDSEKDFLVDREASGGDYTYFNVGIQPLDSSEKLYFSIYTR